MPTQTAMTEVRKYNPMTLPPIRPMSLRLENWATLSTMDKNTMGATTIFNPFMNRDWSFPRTVEASHALAEAGASAPRDKPQRMASPRAARVLYRNCREERST